MTGNLFRKKNLNGLKNGMQKKNVNILLAFYHSHEIKNNNWWKENNTSLILSPEPIIEDVEIRKLKKKSLELAGV